MKHLKFREIFFSAYFILSLLIIAGIMAVIIKPSWLMEDGLAYKVKVNSLIGAKAACFVDHPRYDKVLAVERGGNCVIKYSNSQTGLLSEHEYYGITTQRIPMIWEHNNAWFCVKKGDTSLYLVKAFDSNGAPNAEMRLIHQPFYKEKLFTSETEIGERKIYGFRVDDDLLEGFRLEDDSDSLRLVFSKGIYEAINNTTILSYKESEVFQSLSDSLSSWLEMNVSKEEVFKIIANTRKAMWFRNQKANGKLTDMMGGQIIASHDINSDGFKDLLILTGGTRLTPNSLICYDPIHEEKLWEYAYYEGFIDFDIADIDNDNIPEIIIGTSAPSGRHGANWFDLEDPLYSFYCSLLILDNHGKIKELNGERAHYITGDFNWITKFCVLPDHKIVFTADNYINQEKKFLQILDPATGKLDTLNIYYTNLLELDLIDEKLVMLHREGNQHFKTTFDDEFKEIETRSFVSERVLSPFFLKNSIKLNEKLFWFMNPLTILNQDFKVIYQNLDMGACNALQFKGDKINIISDVGKGNSLLYNIKLLKNDIFNLNLIVTWLLLVVGYLVYIITKAFFNLPTMALDGSYAVLYNIMGVVFNWRIFGVGRVYSQPVIGCLSRKRFEDIMNDITDSYQEVKTRNLGLIKLQFYRMVIGNEMHIMQRIAHDIKNQVHLVNMRLMESNLEEDDDLVGAMQEIFEKSSMLSDFSRINLMQKTNVDLVTLIDNAVMKFYGHPRYNDIVWEVSEDKVLVNADESLLHVAVLNLLDNSLKYSPFGSKVIITLDQEKSTVVLAISNQLKDNKIEISKGSGIGIVATNKIISAHGAIFRLSIDEEAKAEIIFNLRGREDEDE